MCSVDGNVGVDVAISICTHTHRHYRTLFLLFPSRRVWCRVQAPFLFAVNSGQQFNSFSCSDLLADILRCLCSLLTMAADDRVQMASAVMRPICQWTVCSCVCVWMSSLPLSFPFLVLFIHFLFLIPLLPPSSFPPPKPFINSLYYTADFAKHSFLWLSAR